MIELLYRWALADREPLTSYAVEMLSYGETLCSRYHQKNMEVVSLLLHKLKGMYASAKSEYLAAHPTSLSIGKFILLLQYCYRYSSVFSCIAGAQVFMFYAISDMNIV